MNRDADRIPSSEGIGSARWRSFVAPVSPAGAGETCATSRAAAQKLCALRPRLFMEALEAAVAGIWPRATGPPQHAETTTNNHPARDV